MLSAGTPPASTRTVSVPRGGSGTKRSMARNFSRDCASGKPRLRRLINQRVPRRTILARRLIERSDKRVTRG